MNENAAPVVKATGIWGVVWFSHLGIQTWSELAAACASIYTMLLIVGWVVDRYRKWRQERET
jgi:hypothetical protein